MERAPSQNVVPSRYPKRQPGGTTNKSFKQFKTPPKIKYGPPIRTPVVAPLPPNSPFKYDFGPKDQEYIYPKLVKKDGSEPKFAGKGKNPMVPEDPGDFIGKGKTPAQSFKYNAEVKAGLSDWAKKNLGIDIGLDKSPSRPNTSTPPPNTGFDKKAPLSRFPNPFGGGRGSGNLGGAKFAGALGNINAIAQGAQVFQELYDAIQNMGGMKPFLSRLGKEMRDSMIQKRKPVIPDKASTQPMTRLTRPFGNITKPKPQMRRLTKPFGKITKPTSRGLWRMGSRKKKKERRYFFF